MPLEPKCDSEVSLEFFYIFFLFLTNMLQYLMHI